jgi:hypothetical protein
MNDSTNKDMPAASLWGEDMESALAAQDRVLRSRLKAASSQHVARRIQTRVVFAICATALLGFLFILLLIAATAITQ